MSGVRDPGKIMERHRVHQAESNPGGYTPMRKCTGPCKVRRSITQFDGASTACRQCVRRHVQCTRCGGSHSLSKCPWPPETK